MPPVLAIEDILLSLPPHQREVVAATRGRLMEMERKNLELQSELRQATMRVSELESALAAAVTPAVAPPPAQMNLHEIQSGMKAAHQSFLDGVQRKTIELQKTVDDPTFDAKNLVQTTVAKTIKPLPKNFEFVDLQQLRETYTSDGFAPTSALQAPLVAELGTHIDSVRQCTRDMRFANIFNDSIKGDVLRRMFDACKTAESRLGQTSHLTLPSASVVVETGGPRDSELQEVTARQREMTEHMLAISECGEVFNRATRDMGSLEEIAKAGQQLPQLASEYDNLNDVMHAEVDALRRNEQLLVEAGSLLIERLHDQRRESDELQQELGRKLEAKHVEIEGYFQEMTRLLTKTEECYITACDHAQRQSKAIVDMSLCDRKVVDMRKAVEAEVQVQQRYTEGCKYTIFLTTKTKDIFTRMYSNLDESVRARREWCDRLRAASQEQLYNMSEELHRLIAKRQGGDNLLARSCQTQLEAANRSLMGLVQQPDAMEREMERIKELTMTISNSKARMAQSEHDVAEVRSVLGKYATLQFLDRDVSFLTVYDAEEKRVRVRDKLEDAVQRAKEASEYLVEISDPDTRQVYVVEQAIKALEASTSDMTGLMANKAVIEEFDDKARTDAATKLRRHRRLIQHFLDEIREGSNNLSEEEPAVELNVVTLVEGMDDVLALLLGKAGAAVHGGPAQSMGRGTRRDPSAGLRRSEVFGGGGQGQGQGLGHQQGGGGAGGATPLQHHQGGGYHGGAGAGPGGDGRGSIMTENSSALAMEGSDFAAPAEVVHETQQPQSFARFSAKLKLNGDQTGLHKPPGGVELSNTSALGANGFRPNTGVHSFVIRIGSHCQRLLVGFADFGLPLDGYCNSIKYPGCYYLHVGNGTLWAPELRIERQAYTYEAIGSTADGLLRCTVDTGARTISYRWGDLNLGVAFRNVNMTRTLFPAVEVFSHGCKTEFCNDGVNTESTAPTGGRR